ncbi:MAG: lipopolysaccharide kinase InaA family protein, partial [Planctomycetota bacterium]
MFKGYISNTIGRIQWTIHTQNSFLIPYLEQIEGTANNTLLKILREDRYKVIGEFEITHTNDTETYLIKVYKYPHLFQKIKYLFKQTRAFNEFKTTYIAAMKGIPVEVPVAYGEQKGFLSKKSYLVIRKIKHSSNLREFLRSATSLKERKDVLRKFGKLAKDAHEGGIKQDDFSLDNFLVYNDEIFGKKLILIDFERVSIQTISLREKHRVWYLAKLNRAKQYFTNTERLRFLLSYTDGDFSYCKRLARQIEMITIRIQKKDARKFWKQCVNENRKFGVFENANFYGYYRKNYLIETLIKLLDTIEKTDRDIIYTNQFQIFHFTENFSTGLNYRNITRVWMHANALFALRINVPVPACFFKNNSSKEWFLISEVPENCTSLDKYIDSCSDKSPVMPALSMFVKQISP